MAATKLKSGIIKIKKQTCLTVRTGGELQTPGRLIPSLPPTNPHQMFSLHHNQSTTHCQFVIIIPPFSYPTVCLHLHHQFFLLEAGLPFNKCLIICSPLLLPLSLLPPACKLRPMPRVLIMLQAGKEGRPGGSLPSSLMLATLS